MMPLKYGILFLVVGALLGLVWAVRIVDKKPGLLATFFLAWLAISYMQAGWTIVGRLYPHPLITSIHKEAP